MSIYWSEENGTLDSRQAPDQIVDMSYRLRGKTIPVDHAWVLAAEVQRLLPWFEKEKDSALHTIHVAESGNGWRRPQSGAELLHLSRRTRLTIRVPKSKVSNAEKLCGKMLNLSGCEIQIGTSRVKPLVRSTVIFARYLDLGENQNEELFLHAAYQELVEKDIAAPKLLCGRLHSFNTPDGTVMVRSLMLADLDMKDSIKLQQAGMGRNRKMGCGIFLPHKGIKPVADKQ